MSFSNPLHIGHFARDGKDIRFALDPTTHLLTPVSTRPLDSASVIRALRSIGQLRDDSTDNFPKNWCIWSDGDWLTCDRYHLSSSAIMFIVHLMKETECDLLEARSYSTISINDLQKFDD